MRGVCQGVCVSIIKSGVYIGDRSVKEKQTGQEGQVERGEGRGRTRGRGGGSRR